MGGSGRTGRMMKALTVTHERCLVVLIALHSFIVGVAFMIAPEWLVRFGGWSGVDPVFFGRQAGIFHVVLATAYLIEYFRYRGIWVLISAKCYAVLFLGAMCLVEPATWAMAVSAVGDGAMVALAWWVHRSVNGAGAQAVNG